MKQFQKILSVLVLAIGIFHIGFTAQIYNQPDFNSLWFASGGMSMIFFSFINLLFYDRIKILLLEKIIWVATNLIMLVFIIFGIYVMQDLPTMIVSGLIFLMVIGSFVLMKKSID